MQHLREQKSGMNIYYTFLLQMQHLERIVMSKDQECNALWQRIKAARKRVGDAERRAGDAERRARDAENSLIRQTTDDKQRIKEAEARAQHFWQITTQEKQRAREADEKVAQADHRATIAEQRATQAEAEAHSLQQQNEEMVVRVRQAEQTAREAQELKTTEQRAQRLRVEGHDQFWIVHREEIQLTNQELGRGGWAIVRVGKFRGLRVAAKCLHTLIVSDYNRQLFVREMNIAARVRHPNLVQFIGAMMEGEPIILTELMSTSLRAILERRPFNPAQITSISLDVARALNYLHLMQPDPIMVFSCWRHAVEGFPIKKSVKPFSRECSSQPWWH